MALQTLRLPDGQTFSVTKVFGGFGFKSHELNTHSHAMPIGWNIIIHSQSPGEAENHAPDDDDDDLPAALRPRKSVGPFVKPTLESDTMFISTVSNPSSTEFKAPVSPTRQYAMMLWVTLYWYFHQPEPRLQVDAEVAKNTPDEAKPKGEWKIKISREGILKSKNLIPKLERMGLIASAHTSVGTSTDDSGDAWANMFVSRRMFWQIPGRLFLFTLQPNRPVASSFPGSPVSSRPGSPTRADASHNRQSHPQTPVPINQRLDSDLPGGPVPTSMVHSSTIPLGPFYSSSHLPTYYPPPQLQYIFTNGIRHPLRPKPPRMGETFYARFIPSVGQFLSFRVASSSPKPVPHLGPSGPKSPENAHLCTLSDTVLLQMWLENPRVKRFWGGYEPNFLNNALNSTNSFPVIGLWDGVPFGYFEIYWVKEDLLGKHLGGDAQDWDRGLHVLVGEEWARGRVPAWLTALVHWCLTADYRTMNICLEPRIDNERFLDRLHACGFSREKQVSLPHKQSWFTRLRRECWEGPAL